MFYRADFYNASFFVSFYTQPFFSKRCNFKVTFLPLLMLELIFFKNNKNYQAFFAVSRNNSKHSFYI